MQGDEKFYMWYFCNEILSAITLRVEVFIGVPRPRSMISRKWQLVLRAREWGQSILYYLKRMWLTFPLTPYLHRCGFGNVTSNVPALQANFSRFGWRIWGMIIPSKWWVLEIKNGWPGSFLNSTLHLSPLTLPLMDHLIIYQYNTHLESQHIRKKG